MNFEQVLAEYGDKKTIAEACNVSYQAVQQWEESGKVPSGRQFQIEIKTNGKLKADPDPRLQT